MEQWAFGKNPSGSQFLVQGSDWMQTLADHLCWLDPSVVPSAPWPNENGDDRTGTASTLIYNYVNENCGPGAIADRQILTMATDPVAGDSITVAGSMQPVLDLVKDIASDQDLICWTEGQEFNIGQYADVSNSVEFSFDLGDVRAMNFTERAPSANYAAARKDNAWTVSTSAQSISDWRRREGFVDAGEGIALAEANALLADQAAEISVTVDTIEITGQTWRTDWDLGDKVNVKVEDLYEGVLPINEIAGSIASGTHKIVPGLGGARLVPPDLKKIANERVRPREGWHGNRQIEQTPTRSHSPQREREREPERNFGGFLGSLFGLSGGILESLGDFSGSGRSSWFRTKTVSPVQVFGHEFSDLVTFQNKQAKTLRRTDTLTRWRT
jgi:hypothetical protein